MTRWAEYRRRALAVWATTTFDEPFDDYPAIDVNDQHVACAA
jgi:hypothetical protein